MMSEKLVPSEVIITLRNNSLPLGQPVDKIVENETAISVSTKYLSENEQTITHQYADGIVC